MPFNVTRQAGFYDIEVLKYPQLGLVIKSLVIDANFVPLDPNRDNRTVVPAGTILALSATNPKQVVPYAGSGTIVGILSHSTDILVSGTAGTEAVPAYYHEAVLATAKIVNFSAYASAVMAAPGLRTCLFE